MMIASVPGYWVPLAWAWMALAGVFLNRWMHTIRQRNALQERLDHGDAAESYATQLWNEGVRPNLLTGRLSDGPDSDPPVTKAYVDSQRPEHFASQCPSTWRGDDGSTFTCMYLAGHRGAHCQGFRIGDMEWGTS